jgi:dTDP-4-dehydrorhamnose 3,5-epimerase
MIFQPTSLAGAFIVDIDPREDSRGLFARTFCVREFAAVGLEKDFVQCSVSFNRFRGTLRGLHYQLAPCTEAKLVRCTSGAIHDVIVDFRPDSPTYLRHFSIELSAKNRRALYVPKMFAHGLQTLEDDTEIFYHISEYYAPEQSTGLKYDDPVLGISWPLPISSISDKDAAWPRLEAVASGSRLRSP